MIHCPYCGAQMADDAGSCPECRSLMVETGAPARKRLPTALHPLSVTIIIAVFSAGLLAVSLMNKKSETPAQAGLQGDSISAKPARPAPSGAGQADRSSHPEEPSRTQPALVETNQEQYDQIVNYVARLQEIIEEAKKLDTVINGMVKQNDKSKIPEISQKLREFQVLSGKVRGLAPPQPVRMAHTRIANSFAIQQRGYRNITTYMESGDVNKLDRGRRDLETAEKTRAQGLNEIYETERKIKPPESPGETGPAVDTVESETVQEQPTPRPPVMNEPQRRPPMSRDERIKRNDARKQRDQKPRGPGVDMDEAPPPENGDSVYMEEGDSVMYEQDGQTPYDDGTYPEDEGGSYQDDGGTYPDNGEYPPDGGQQDYPQGQPYSPQNGPPY